MAYLEVELENRGVWELVVAGPSSGKIYKYPASNVELRIEATIPNNDDNGVPFPSDDVELFTIKTGENLYAKSLSRESSLKIQT